MFDDFDIIVASLAEQYGVRMYSREFKEMKWNEFKALLAGIGPNTPLGRIVSIRAETDKEVLKSYTPDMHRIRNEWRNKHALKRKPEEINEFLDMMKNAFMKMGGVDGKEKEN